MKNTMCCTTAPHWSLKVSFFLLLRDETLELMDLQARVSIQRIHLGVPAVVVDGVSLCHPQHWTLQERRQTNSTYKTIIDSRQCWCWTWTGNQRGCSLLWESVWEPEWHRVRNATEFDFRRHLQKVNGFYGNCFCSVIPIHHQVVIHWSDWVNTQYF